MLLHRRAARDFLLEQDRPTFLEIVYRAKVTPTQRDIIYMDLLDYKSHREIGDDIGLTENRVSHIVGEAYDKVFNYLIKNNFVTV